MHMLSRHIELHQLLSEGVAGNFRPGMAEFSFASRLPFWLHLDNMSSFWPLSPGQIRCNQAYKGPIYSPLLQWMLNMLPVCIFASRWILRHLCQVLEIWAGAQDLCSDIAVTPRLSIMKISRKNWQLHSIITDFITTGCLNAGYSLVSRFKLQPLLLLSYQFPRR